MKLLTKQQALKAYLAGYKIVYDDSGKYSNEQAQQRADKIEETN